MTLIQNFNVIKPPSVSLFWQTSDTGTAIDNDIWLSSVKSMARFSET